MKVYANQLSQHLKQGLAPIYVISGDVPLLVQEARDHIRQTAQQAGYQEREYFVADQSFDWQRLTVLAQSLSLFSEKTVLEVHLPTGKPGDAGNKTLIAYSQQLPRDKILLLITGKLDKAAQKSKWYQALDDKGVVLPIWPIDKTQFPNWLRNRLHQANLQVTPEGIQLLAQRTEGNLLAAKQAIEKLLLLYGESKLNLSQVTNAISDSARFNLFQLVDEALANQPKKVTRILTGLQQEDTEPTLILWAIARELRSLTKMAFLLNKGRTLSQIMQQYKVWEKRKLLIKAALQRHSYKKLLQLLQQAAYIDRIIKGAQTGNSWQELSTLLLSICYKT